MNGTIDYYNRTAEDYFARTSDIGFDELYRRFLKYVPDGGRIMDLGCGSGRDVKWFCDHGYQAFGLDASPALASKAAEEFGIQVQVGTIEDWISDEPYDAIWSCASLMHLDDESISSFLDNLKHNLKPGGVLFLSIKSGIETGLDEHGRYFRNFTEEDIHKITDIHSELKVKELWYTEDKLARDTFKWMNVIFEYKEQHAELK